MGSTMDIIHPNEDHHSHPYNVPLCSAASSARSANVCTVQCQAYLLWCCFLC
jgi:hypothetical protein